MATNNIQNAEFARQILAEYGDFILKIILFRVQNEEIAYDIFQDFFISLASKPLPVNVDDIKSYLYKAVINDIADAMRRTQRYNHYLKKYQENFNFTINISDPTDALIEEEQRNQMCDFLVKQLPDSYSKAITGRFCNDQSSKEVAETMGVKRTSVSKYISCGLDRLRQMLSL